jgi:hypothetical protein
MGPREGLTVAGSALPSAGSRKGGGGWPTSWWPPPPDPVGGEQPAARHPCDGSGGSAAMVAPFHSGVDVFLVFSCLLENAMDSFIAIGEGLKRDRSHVRWNFFKLNQTFFSCFLWYEKDAVTNKKGGYGRKNTRGDKM